MSLHDLFADFNWLTMTTVVEDDIVMGEETVL